MHIQTKTTLPLEWWIRDRMQDFDGANKDRVIARLIETLAEKGILSQQETYYICTGNDLEKQNQSEKNTIVFKD